MHKYVKVQPLIEVERFLSKHIAWFLEPYRAVKPLLGKYNVEALSMCHPLNPLSFTIL